MSLASSSGDRVGSVSTPQEGRRVQVGGGHEEGHRRPGDDEPPLRGTVDDDPCVRL